MRADYNGDLVSIPTEEETWTYFWNENSRRAVGTGYTLSQEPYTNGDANTPWWLRSNRYID